MGRSRIRAAPVVATLAAITALGAMLVTSAGAASSPSLTANKHVLGFAAVAYGRTITLAGHESLGGTQPYALQAEAWPFTGGFHTVAHGSTTGSYSIGAKPSHATRYRISVGGQSSAVLTVYVVEPSISSSCSLCNHSNVSGTHTLVVEDSFLTPPGPRATGPAYFYYGLGRNTSKAPTTLSLIQTVPRRFSGNKFSVKITYTVHFPLGQFAFAYDFCWKGNESKTGVGLPGTHHCGDPTINRFNYAG